MLHLVLSHACVLVEDASQVFDGRLLAVALHVKDFHFHFEINVAELEFALSIEVQDEFWEGHPGFGWVILCFKEMADA